MKEEIKIQEQVQEQKLEEIEQQQNELQDKQEQEEIQLNNKHQQEQQELLQKEEIIKNSGTNEEEQNKKEEALKREKEELDKRQEAERQWKAELDKNEQERLDIEKQAIIVKEQKSQAYKEALNQYVGGLSDAQNNLQIQQAAYQNRQYTFMKNWKIPVLQQSYIKNGVKYYTVNECMEIFPNQLQQIQQTVRNDLIVFPYDSTKDDIIDVAVQSIMDMQNKWLEYYNLLPKGSVLYFMQPLQHANSEGSPFVYGKYVLRFCGVNQNSVISGIKPFEFNKYVLMGDLMDKIGMTVKYNDPNEFVKITQKLNENTIQKNYTDEYEIYLQSTKKFEDHNHMKDQNEGGNFGNNYHVENVQTQEDKLIFARGTNAGNDQTMRIYQPSQRKQYTFDNNDVIGTFKAGNNNSTSSKIYLNSDIILQHGRQLTDNENKEDWKYSFYMDNLSTRCYMYVIVDYVFTNDAVGLQHNSDQLQFSVFNTGGQI